MGITTPKTVDGILAGFTKLVAQLETLSERKTLEATAHFDAAQASNAAGNAAALESERAADKAKQIAAIFG